MLKYLNMESFQNVFDSISNVFEKTSGCGLGADSLTMLTPDFTVLSERLQLTQNEALLFSVIINLNYREVVVEQSTLIDYFKCTPTRVYALAADLETLCKKGILRKVKSNSDKTPLLHGIGYMVEESYASGLGGENRPNQRKRGKRYSNQLQMISDIYKAITLAGNGKIDTQRMFRFLKRIMQKGKNLPVAKLINSLRLADVDILFFAYLLWENLTGESSTNAKILSDRIFDDTSDMRVNFYMSFVSQTNTLCKAGLLAKADAPAYEEAEFKFSVKAVKMLKDVGIEIPYEHSEKFTVIRSGEIVRKSLFLNSEDQNNLMLFEKAVTGENYNTISEGFRHKGLPSGVVALFHGFPGTGKTESVLQIAAASGRDIMKVDISQARSKWYGSSERIVKSIFAEYHEYSTLCDRTPILLFNEADAILSSRNTGDMSSAQKAENNIQNIILEELENFDGIFIATTNLLKNIDSAFDRRFLFKVRFTKPTVDVRYKIWQDKFTELNIEECLELATGYELTGGQIDNVYRKSQISALVNCTPVTAQSVKVYCEQERDTRVQGRTGKIGFLKSAG